MSQRTVQFIIGRILTDEVFRDDFTRQPAATIASLRGCGLDLTALEATALLAIDPQAWETMADRIDPRLQGIDVTDVRGAHEMTGMRGHGYWYSNEWIANDVLLALRYPISPEKRCLVQVAPGKRMWKFPDDYPDCIVRELLKVNLQLQRRTE